MKDDDQRTTEEGRSIQPKIEAPALKDLPAALYANYVSVSHTPHEMTLLFAQVSAPTSDEDIRDMGMPPVLKPKPVTRVSIPISLVDSFLEALTMQRTRLVSEGTLHEETHD